MSDYYENRIQCLVFERDRLRAEVATLKRHYDAAAPEHNLLALLDLYEERERAAVVERDRLRAFIDAVGRCKADGPEYVIGSLVAERDQARAECERLNKYIATHDEEYATMKETLRAEHQECQRLRSLLATPCETEVRWYNNGRGPRVVFEVGSDDYVVTVERAKSIGAALLRAALDADATNDGKGGDRG